MNEHDYNQLICEINHLRDENQRFESQLAACRTELEEAKSGRVPCSCGQDTADIKYAQCYKCRQSNAMLVQENAEFESELEKARKEREYQDECLRNTADERDRISAECAKLKSALHDAEAIGDFSEELRDRLALKEAAACVPGLMAENDRLRAEFAKCREELEACKLERDFLRADLEQRRVITLSTSSLGPIPKPE